MHAVVNFLRNFANHLDCSVYFSSQSLLEYSSIYDLAKKWKAVCFEFYTHWIYCPTLNGHCARWHSWCLVVFKN